MEEDKLYSYDMFITENVEEALDNADDLLLEIYGEDGFFPMSQDMRIVLAAIVENLLPSRP